MSGFKEYYGNTIAGNLTGTSALAYKDDNKGISSLFLFQRVRGPPSLSSLMLLSPLRKEQWELRVNENAGWEHYTFLLESVVIILYLTTLFVELAYSILATSTVWEANEL